MSTAKAKCSKEVSPDDDDYADALRCDEYTVRDMRQTESFLSSYRVSIGSKIAVYWEEDNAYYPGVVASYKPKFRRYKVLYDDGDVEKLNLTEERFRII